MWQIGRRSFARPDELRSQPDRREVVLVQAAHPKRIIFFGSQASGDAAPHSDFDIMVVEEKPVDRFAEMVRLNRLIRSFNIAVDLLVVSDRKVSVLAGKTPAMFITKPQRGRSFIKRREQALLFLRRLRRRC